MRYFVKRVWSLMTHVQVLVVVLMFMLMVAFSYYFMSGIERRHLLNNVDNIMANVQSFIETDISGMSTTLGVISENIRNMIMNNVPPHVIHNNLLSITQFLSRYEHIEDEQTISHITSVYGYFDVFDGLFLSGTIWQPPPDFIPSERPWFVAGIAANGKVGVTQPYINAQLGNTIITFSRAIFDDEGRRLGIISLDVAIERISDYIVNISINEESYGVLFDKEFRVLAHPNPDFMFSCMSEINDGLIFKERLRNGLKINEFRTVDFEGVPSVFFARKLSNNWYLAVFVNAQSYYESVVFIGIFLVVLGFICAVILCAILLSIITSRKNAEERIKLMIDALPLCATFWDKNYKIIECNRASMEMFEVSSKKEFIDNFYNMSPLYHQDGRLSKEKYIEYIKKAFDEGYCRFEWTFKTLKEKTIPCETTLVRVKYKNRYMVCGYIDDLSELKMMITKMRESDECTKVMFDATPLSCILIDKDLKILEVNQEIERLLGVSNKSEFINNPFEFVPVYQPSGKNSAEMLINYAKEAFAEGYCRFEFMHQNINKEPVPTEISFVRVKFKGEYAVTAYMRDLRELKAMLTEMQRAEIAEESSKAKSDFLARMSHEIRTPMNAIMGITEIQLQDNSLPIVTKEALERIYNSGNLLVCIINDILDLSKIEAGKLEIAAAKYDITSLIYDTVKLNIIRFQSHPIDFKLVVSENIPVQLLGDELRIKQILNNLLSNAFKYTQKGYVELSVCAEPRDNLCVDMVFKVSDTGQGMTQEQVRHLGEKFGRFNISANRNTEGTGLGMNITNNLVDMMDGSIHVESAPNKGSVFTVRLPQRFDSSLQIGKDLADNLMKLNLKSTTKIRNSYIKRHYMPYGSVLAVDDVETNLYVVKGILSPYGLNLDTVLSGEEAIQKIKDGKVYDIIFMDHMMPKMDGIEAVKIIRELGYTKPIVALTANALFGQSKIFLDNGFDDYLFKPIDVRELNLILNKLIRDKQSAETLEAARKQKNKRSASGGASDGGSIVVQPKLAEVFVRDAEKAVDVLVASSKNNYRRADDIANLLINAHAMKSVLANVGEHELSKDAAMLEQAAREQKIDIMMEALPDFIEALQNVIVKFKPNVESSGDNDAEIITGSKEFLKQNLLVIQRACEYLNKKMIRECLTALREKTWEFAVKEQFKQLDAYILHSEFDEAGAFAKKMIDELDKEA